MTAMGEEMSAENAQLWQRYLKEKPTNEELLQMMFYSEFFSEQAWSQLLAQSPNKDELFEAAKCVHAGTQALEMLISCGATNDQLMYFVRYREDLRNGALAQLKKQNSPEQYESLVQEESERQEHIRQHRLSDDTLMFAYMSRVSKWRKLLQDSPRRKILAEF